MHAGSSKTILSKHMSTKKSNADLEVEHRRSSLVDSLSRSKDLKAIRVSDDSKAPLINVDDRHQVKSDVTDLLIEAPESALLTTKQYSA